RYIASARSRKRSTSPTAPNTASPPTSTARTSARRWRWRSASRQAVSGSTSTTSPSCKRRSAAGSSPVSAASSDRRDCTPIWKSGTPRCAARPWRWNVERATLRDPDHRDHRRRVLAPPGGQVTRPAPLEGVVVAGFCRVPAGPLMPVMLAELGAEVIKVERPETGDETRAWGPPWTDESSTYFECANRSKKSITLDLQDPDDLAAARELAARADVVVENFKAGTMARFGLDYPSVKRTNPRVVYCSISGFGSGEGADLPGYDFLVQAVGGLMSITGPADGPPMKVGVALVDVLTS